MNIAVERFAYVNHRRAQQSELHLALKCFKAHVDISILLEMFSNDLQLAQAVNFKIIGFAN